MLSHVRTTFLTCIEHTVMDSLEISTMNVLYAVSSNNILEPTQYLTYYLSVNSKIPSESLVVKCTTSDFE